MNLRRARRLIYKIVYHKKLLNKYGKDLKPGKYHLFNNMHFIVHNDENTIALAKKYFHNENKSEKITSIVSRVNKSKFYSNKKKSGNNKFDAIYFANNYDKKQEIKLFSFERNVILTVCPSAEIRDKQLEAYKVFHNSFNMPGVSPCDEYDNSYIISMVDLKARPAEAEALSHICRCVADYYKNNTNSVELIPVGETVSFAYENAEFNTILGLLTSKIDPALLNTSLPHCLQHGDLSQSNLLYGICEEKEDFWWIDWEHARKRSFFFDYFFYIFNTAFFLNNPQILDDYFSGKTVNSISELFTAFGLKYEPKYRIDYFIIFAVEFLKERVCDINNIDSLRMFYKFINDNILDKK